MCPRHERKALRSTVAHRMAHTHQHPLLAGNVRARARWLAAPRDQTNGQVLMRRGGGKDAAACHTGPGWCSQGPCCIPYILLAQHDKLCLEFFSCKGLTTPTTKLE